MDLKLKLKPKAKNFINFDKSKICKLQTKRIERFCKYLSYILRVKLRQEDYSAKDCGDDIKQISTYFSF
jgi:hypothetical protein